MSYTWITIPHQGRPSIFGPFEDMAETLDFIQEHESSEKFNTQPMLEIFRSAGVEKFFADIDVEEFLADAARQYHHAYIKTKEELIDSLKNPRWYGHSWVELFSESRKFAFEHWHDEAREEFIDGFAETCGGGENRADAEMIWDNWSSGIQDGPNGEGFRVEIEGEEAGREEGRKYREHFRKEVEA